MWWEEVVGGGGGRRALVEAAAEALAIWQFASTWEFLCLSIGSGEGKICTETKHKSGTALCYGCNGWRLQPADGRLHTNQADKDK
jgi:hypothetical protein